MSKDLAFPIPPRGLNSLEKRIFAHQQVGELAPFAPEVLILGFDACWERGAIEAAARDVLARHPAFTARFVTRPGGEAERHSDATTELALIAGGDLDAVEAQARGHRPDLETPAFAELWALGKGRHILALTLHPLLADDAVLGSVEAALWHALDPENAPSEGEDGALTEGDLDRTDRARRLRAWQDLLDSHVIARLPHRHEASEGGTRLRHSVVFSANLSDAMDRAGTETVLATGLALLLRRYGGNDSLRFALGVAGGGMARSGGAMPVCIAPDPARGFAATQAAMARVIAEGKAHRLPAETLVQDRLSRPDADRHPLGAVSLHLLPARPQPPYPDRCRGARGTDTRALSRPPARGAERRGDLP